MVWSMVDRAGGADNSTVVHRRCKARQTLWASEARWQGPGMKRAVRRSQRRAHRGTRGVDEVARRRGRMVAARARCEHRRKQEEARD
jgi:hypothetical protein